MVGTVGAGWANTATSYENTAAKSKIKRPIAIAATTHLELREARLDVVRLGRLGLGDLARLWRRELELGEALLELARAALGAVALVARGL